MTTDRDQLREALEAALNVLENSGAASGYCMCGDPVDGHTIGSGHSPVDSHIYMAEQVISQGRAALATPDQAVMAERERCAQVAMEGNAHWRKLCAETTNKREARDYETMAIACVHVAAAIRAQGEVK